LERKEIILTPGKEISDVAPELLSDMQWSRVENLYSDKVGRFVPLRGLNNKLPDTIRYYRTSSIKATATSILNAIEWNGYLFLVVKSSTYINLVRLIKDGESYTQIWNDGSEDICFSYFARDDDFVLRENLGTEDIRFVPYASELRVVIGDYVNIIKDCSGKVIKDYSGTTLFSYGENLLTDFVGTYKMEMLSRKIKSDFGSGNPTIRYVSLYRQVTGEQYFNNLLDPIDINSMYQCIVANDKNTAGGGSIYYNTATSYNMAVIVAAMTDSGQIGLVNIISNTVATKEVNGSNVNLTEDSVVAAAEKFGHTLENSDGKWMDLVGFDVDVVVANIPPNIDSLLVFAATTPDASDLTYTSDKDVTGNPISDIDVASMNFRLVKTIKLDNQLEYNLAKNRIGTIPISGFSVSLTIDAIIIKYDDSTNSDEAWPAAKYSTSFYPGMFVRLYNEDGTEQTTKIESVSYSSSGSTGEYEYFITITLEDNIISGLRDGFAIRGDTEPPPLFADVEPGTFLELYESPYPRSGGSILTYHIAFDIMDLKTFPLLTDVYPYNAVLDESEYYPEFTEYLIWDNQAFAKTNKDGEEYYLRYSPPNGFDILPPDQVHEVALEGIQNIVPLNDRLIIIGQKGITQGNILSQDFYLEFSDSTAGIIRPGAYVVHNGILYFMSDQDVYAFNGNTVQSVLKNSMIKNYYRDNIKEAEGFIVYSKYYSGLIIFMSETKGLLINDFGTSRWVLDENMIFAITDSDGDMVLFDDSASGFKIDPTEVYSDEYYLEAKELNERAFSAKQLTDVFIDTSYEGDIEVVSKDLRTNVTSNIVRAVDSTFGIEKRMSPRLIFNALSLNFEFTDSVGDFEIGRIRLWLKNLGR
jgi:hypothetical protein